MEGREWTISGFVLLLLPEICCPALVVGREGSLGWAVSHPPGAARFLTAASYGQGLGPALCGRKVFPPCMHPPPLHKHVPIWSNALSSHFSGG